MSIENGRVPRPGTIRAEALRAFENREPRAVIMERTGRPRRSVDQAIRDVEQTCVKGDPEREIAFRNWLASIKSTTAGFAFYRTEAYRIKMSEAHKGHRSEILSLFNRGVSTAEVVYITGLTVNNVRAVKNSEWRTGHAFSRKGDALRIDKTRGQKIMRFLRGDKTVGSFNDLDFVKKLYEAGFVTVDLTNWQELHKLYNQHGRELPQSFADRIRLEVFCIGVRALLEKGREKGGVILAEYARLGREVDEEWFKNSLSQEQKFIKDCLEREWVLQQTIVRRSSNRDGKA